MLTALRYLILSDIHANNVALQAVLRDAEGLYDRIVSCGDVVGYGPEPNAVVEFCRTRCSAIVRGNHDKASAGLLDLDWFNDVAQQSARWTATTVSRENLRWLQELPEGPLEHDGFQLMHGSPRDEDEYVLSAEEAGDVAPYLTTGLGFFGHTHVQGGFELHRNGVRRLSDTVVALEETSGYLINPGSVGQPRDNDPRAAWAIYDSSDRTVELRRTQYEVWRVLDRILDLGLPQVLGLRLFAGM